MRTVIDIPDEDVNALAEICKRQEISRAEAIRRALKNMLAENAVKARNNAFGAWKRKIDSRAFINELRAEWDR